MKTGKESQVLQASNLLSGELSDLLDIAENNISLKTFGYRRFLSNGSSFGFSTSNKWNEFYANNFLNKTRYYDACIKNYLQSEKNFFLRAGFPDQNDFMSQTLYELDIWNTFAIFRKNSESKYIELFFMCSTKNNFSLIETCINKLDYITQWTDMIAHRINRSLPTASSELFTQTVNDSKILLEMENFLYYDTSKKWVDSQKSANEFIEKHKLILSNREKEIFKLLAKGFKRKQIAVFLELSPKTIDTYTDRLKKKFNFFSKHQMLTHINTND